VVTRSYGGTKLGTGGLGRAYGDAAAAALDAAEVVEHVHRAELRVRFAYEDTAAARQTVHRFAAEVAAEAYGAETEWVVRVPRSAAEAFAQAFTDALAGRGRIEGG
jgi:putative IMPACT (imprinted ancient) family translation regulator